MCLEVRTQSSGLSKSPPAVLTLVRLLPGVQSLVAPQCGGLAKGAETVVTLVGSLASVDPSVSPQAPL